jgi:hypothetical protein
LIEERSSRCCNPVTADTITDLRDYLASNPLAALMRFANMPTWYIGSLSDRWSADLRSFTLQSRDLPDGLGAAWLVVVCLSVLLSIWGKSFWTVIGLLVSFLSTYLFSNSTSAIPTT